MSDVYPIRSLMPNDFPRRLREINDPPKKLYLRGTMPPEEAHFLAVVGARRYTPYGKDACERLIAGLAGQPIVIVSGLALGIDSIAHRAALSAGLATVAVPGSGLADDVLYPPANRHTAEKILEAGGALVSEFEPDFRATPYSFPQRNRVMAGLSDAVLVIEAEAKSGTLITAKLATGYNRDVLAVPGSIYARNSEGPHLLIRLGATPITKCEDILEALHIQAPTKPEDKYKDCSADEIKVVDLLHEPLRRDILIEKLNIGISQANILLSVMELKNLIEESMGEIRLK